MGGLGGDSLGARFGICTPDQAGSATVRRCRSAQRHFSITAAFDAKPVGGRHLDASDSGAHRAGTRRGIDGGSAGISSRPVSRFGLGCHNLTIGKDVFGEVPFSSCELHAFFQELHQYEQQRTALL
jgi:hypothetical protein